MKMSLISVGSKTWLMSVSSVGSASDSGVAVAVAVGLGTGPTGMVVGAKNAPTAKAKPTTVEAAITLRSRLATDGLTRSYSSKLIELTVAFQGFLNALNLLWNPLDGSVGLTFLVGGEFAFDEGLGLLHLPAHVGVFCPLGHLLQTLEVES